jgi:hypothetical protein
MSWNRKLFVLIPHQLPAKYVDHTWNSLIDAAGEDGWSHYSYDQASAVKCFDEVPAAMQSLFDSGNKTVVELSRPNQDPEFVAELTGDQKVAFYEEYMAYDLHGLLSYDLEDGSDIERMKGDAENYHGHQTFKVRAILEKTIEVYGL